MSHQESIARSAAVKAGSSVNVAFTVLAGVQATLIFTIALIMIPLPAIGQEFGLCPVRILLLQVGYGLPFSGLLLFGGRLTDRYGAKPIFSCGLALFGAASVGAALTPSYQFLVAMRFLEGVGGAMIAPAALGLVRNLFPDMVAFARAMAVWGGVSVLGAVLGFISSGMISSLVSWRWMFAVPVVVSVLGLSTGTSLLPRRQARRRRSPPSLDLLGAALATGGIVLVSFGLIASHEQAWVSPLVCVPVLAGLALLAAFIVAESKAREPLLPPRFLLNRFRLFGLFGMLLAAAASLLIEFLLLTYLQEIRRWNAFQTAASFIPFAIALIAANASAPAIVRRIGAPLTAAAGFWIAGSGLASLSTLGQHTPYATVLLPGQLLVAVGIALVFSAAAVLATHAVAAEQMGLAGGVMNTAMELGPTVGFALLMAVAATRADTVEGYATAFATGAAVYFLTPAIAWLAGAFRSAPDHAQS